MGKILFAKHDGVHVLKFVGDVRVTLGPTISNFLNRIKKAENLKSIVIDLTETTGIDSTSLGLLAKISLQSQESLGAKPTLISTNEDVNRILSSMGFEQVFVIVNEHNAGQTAESQELGELPTQMVSDTTMRQQVLEAHRTLMSLNARNHDAFCNLVDALQQEQDEEQQSDNNCFQDRKAS